MDKIKFEKEGGTAIVTFSHPSERNCLSSDVLSRITEFVGRAERDADISKLIFTGVEGVFASGADLKEIAGLGMNEAKAFAETGQKIISAIANTALMTIAAVNGSCFGGALDLALSCDVRIASPTAVFCHPGASLGIITGWGGTQMLPRKIGQGRALEMFFTGRRVKANEALEMGLVDSIAEEVLAEAMAY